LVAAAPEYQVGVFQMLCLLFGRDGFDKLDPFLLAAFDLLIELFGVTSQSCVRVQESLLVGEEIFLEFRIIVLFCLFYRAIKHPDLVSIENFNISLSEMVW